MSAEVESSATSEAAAIAAASNKNGTRRASSSGSSSSEAEDAAAVPAMTSSSSGEVEAGKVNGNKNQDGFRQDGEPEYKPRKVRSKMPKKLVLTHKELSVNGS
jgi:hypothetical protein